ncbi:MAG: hypothetical protein ACI3XA_07280 [Clostridia bacterium]
MKTKRFLALFIALAMILVIVPAISVSAEETKTVTESLSGEIVWSAPTVGGLYDASVSTYWQGWNATGYYANLRTYDGYDVLQFYSANQTDLNATVTASTAVKNATKGSDVMIIEWKHKGQPHTDNYYSFTFRDANGAEITTVTLDKNFPVVIDSHKMGFPINYIDMAIVYYNNPDGKTHTVEYYVAGEKVYTDSAFSGTVDGFGSIVGSNGWWTNYTHIGLADLTIATAINSATAVDVTATYTVDGSVVKTETKRYDSLKNDHAAFPAFNYSANGSSDLYTAEAVNLSESAVIEMKKADNTGEYKNGDALVYDGNSYTILSDNLIPNADFAFGLDGWYNGSGSNAASYNFTVNDNVLTIVNGGNSIDPQTLYRAWDVEVGKTYFLTFTLDAANEWTKVLEGPTSENTIATNVLIGRNDSVTGKNNLVFTASDEFVRISFAWAAGKKVFDFGLYEIKEAE